MAHSRHTGRKDAAHKPIVAELQQRGFVVFDVSSCAGLGFDVVVFRATKQIEPIYGADAGRWIPFEIKSPGREHVITKAEQKAQAKAPIAVVSSVAEILKYF